MAASKPSTPSAPRRKSSKPSMVVTLKLSPEALQTFAPPPIKEESPSKDSSSATSNTLPAVASANGDMPSESNSNTPAASGTPAPTLMPPPTEGLKKKGLKRTSGATLDPNAPPKVRGKPGPKKRPRLEDGTIDHSGDRPRAAPGTAAHKLGPKANQGAINAGLRALDRSGKPCRRWHKGGFRLKSFTGVKWEIPTWTAPPKVKGESTTDDSASGSSSKENKDISQVESEKSNSAADVESGNSPADLVSSPIPSQAASEPEPSTAPVVVASA